MIKRSNLSQQEQQDCFNQGLVAAKKGLLLKDCPYKVCAVRRSRWIHGWWDNGGSLNAYAFAALQGYEDKETG